MGDENPSRLDKWRGKYGALVVTLLCLYSLITNWGDNWILVGFFGLGVLICGTIGVFDVMGKNSRQG